MKKNQKGFSVIEGLIILIVIGAIGFGGWYVYDSRKSEDKKDATSSESRKNDEESQESDAPELTTELTSHNKAFSLSLPDGWKVTNDTELDYALAVGLENMTYDPGKPAEIIDEAGHRGGGLTTSKFVIQLGATSDLENYFSASEEQGSFQTTGGLEGKSYLFAPTETNEETGAVAGSKTYGYQFTKDDKTVVISYTMLEGDPNQLEVVEAAVKTLKLL